VLAAENANFYSDSGISPKALLARCWVNLRGGSAQAGRLDDHSAVREELLPDAARTFKRKIREPAVDQIDQKLSKGPDPEDYRTPSIWVVALTACRPRRRPTSASTWAN